MSAVPEPRKKLAANITTTIRHCARCKLDHKNLTFRPLTRPLECDGTMTHWVSCPTNGEPIMLTVTDDG